MRSETIVSWFAGKSQEEEMTKITTTSAPLAKSTVAQEEEVEVKSSTTSVTTVETRALETLLLSTKVTVGARTRMLSSCARNVPREALAAAHHVIEDTLLKAPLLG